MADTQFFEAIAIRHKSGETVYPVMKQGEPGWGVTINGVLITEKQQIVSQVISGQCAVRCSNAQGQITANLTLGKPAAPGYELDVQFQHLVRPEDVQPDNLQVLKNPALDTALPELTGNELDPYLTRTNGLLVAVGVLVVMVLVLL